MKYSAILTIIGSVVLFSSSLKMDIPDGGLEELENKLFNPIEQRKSFKTKEKKIK